MVSTNIDSVFYVVFEMDNVATALADIPPGLTKIRGGKEGTIMAKEAIPFGYKIALADIRRGEDIIKYQCPIAVASKDIAIGEYVHIHNAKSKLDSRSNAFDAETAQPQDIEYRLV
jgi:hypothetical protein